MRPNPYDALAYIDMRLWWRLVIRNLIVAWCLVVMAAALYTGAAAGLRFFVNMTGFLPPHYGYSAYATCVLLFLAPWWWVRSLAGAALLASGNRASWVGSLAGWAWRGGRRRLALAGILGALAVVGGLALKPKIVRARTDSDRVMIWKSVLGVIREHPEGIGSDYAIGVAGLEVSHAHSDVLEIALRWGVKISVLILLVVGWGFYRAPNGPEKAALVCLTAQSIIDNRVTTSWACAGLYAALWLAALLRARRSGRTL